MTRTGIDIRGVLWERGWTDADIISGRKKCPSSSGNVPIVEGAMDGLLNLVKHVGPSNIVLFSDERNLEDGYDLLSWMEKNRIFAMTGIRSTDVVLTQSSGSVYCSKTNVKAHAFHKLDLDILVSDSLKTLSRVRLDDEVFPENGLESHTCRLVWFTGPQCSHFQTVSNWCQLNVVFNELFSVRADSTS